MRSLPPKVLREIRAYLYDAQLAGSGTEKWVAAIDRALSPKRGSSARKAQAKSKKAAKREKTATVRALVMVRAAWRCELSLGPDGSRCTQDATELHHAFGRARADSFETCLALCSACHRELTENADGAVACWLRVADTFARLGLDCSAAWAQRLADKHETKSTLEEMRKAGVL